MLKKIIDKHKEMMYEFIDLTGISDPELAWICFIKGVLFTLYYFGYFNMVYSYLYLHVLY